MTREATDNFGNVAYQRGNYPYGDMWYDTGTATPSVKRKFTSYQMEPELSGSLNNAIAREHSARMGRFQTPDSVRGNIFSPQRLNLYSYVRNDPVNRTDPNGLAEVDTGALPPDTFDWGGGGGDGSGDAGGGAVGGGGGGGGGDSFGCEPSTDPTCGPGTGPVCDPTASVSCGGPPVFCDPSTDPTCSTGCDPTDPNCAPPVDPLVQPPSFCSPLDPSCSVGNPSGALGSMPLTSGNLNVPCFEACYETCILLNAELGVVPILVCILPCYAVCTW